MKGDRAFVPETEPVHGLGRIAFPAKYREKNLNVSNEGTVDRRFALTDVHRLILEIRNIVEIFLGFVIVDGFLGVALGDPLIQLARRDDIELPVVEHTDSDVIIGV